MNKLRLAKIPTTAVAISLALFMLTGCQQEEAQPLTAEEKIVAPDDHVRDLLKRASSVNQQAMDQSTSVTTAAIEEIGENMNTITFDGSSEESFRAALEEFQLLANSSEISDLNAALQYLKVYDVSARGNLKKLYHNLDGLTAEQIVQRATSMRKK